MEIIVGINNFNINNNSIFFMRHAQYLGNINNFNDYDSPISKYGILESTKLNGFFDIILCSPLKRCKETLFYSKISYTNFYINFDLREKIKNKNDCIQDEYFILESDNSFRSRVNNFHKFLEMICNTHYNKKILIISHGYFLNTWFRRGCYPKPTNATIYKLL